MLSSKAAFNLRYFLPHFLNKSVLASQNYRALSTKIVETSANSVQDVSVQDEEILAQEALIEEKRNKSQLFESDYNKQHGRMPYDEPQWEYHESLQYRRRMYGRYGEASKVDPSILWPSKKELAAMKEYESISNPFTFKQLVENSQQKRAEKEERTRKKEAEILAKVNNVQKEIIAFHKRVAVQKAKALELARQKEALVEKVRQHFGYKLNPKDEKFRAMLEKLQKDERKKLKAEKKAKVEEKQQESKKLEPDAVDVEKSS